MKNALEKGEEGSSPLARGLRSPSAAGPMASGIIPARAGFTRRSPTSLRPSPDHPRSRGVYLARPGPRFLDDGSSPLARGLPPIPGTSSRDLGIIPARAGFTSSTPRTGPESQDHPRSRGVYGTQMVAGITKAGSSPLARGLLAGILVQAVTSRIIPARAGFTGACARWWG